MRKYRTSSSSAAPSSTASSSAAAPSSSSSGSSIGDDVYSGVALFGRGTALFGAIITTILGIVFIIVGIALIREKTVTVSGTVDQDSTCSNGTCSVYLTYTYNGQKYTGSQYTYSSANNSLQYHKGDVVNVIINPDNATVIGIGKISTKAIGWSMIAIAVILMIITWVWFYFTMKSKGFAAVTGSVGLIEDVFHR